MLITQATGSGTITYTQDLVAPLSQILSDGQARYVYGNERLFGDDGIDRTWYVGDALGSVRLTLNADALPLQTTIYDPWGMPQRTLSAPFGFTGELQQGCSISIYWAN